MTYQSMIAEEQVTINFTRMYIEGRHKPFNHDEVKFTFPGVPDYKLSQVESRQHYWDLCQTI